MKKYIKTTHRFLAQRGHMVSFLMMSLMVTAWMNTFQETVNASIISTYM